MVPPGGVKGKIYDFLDRYERKRRGITTKDDRRFRWCLSTPHLVNGSWVVLKKGFMTKEEAKAGDGGEGYH